MIESLRTVGADAGALFEIHGACLYRFACVLLQNAEDAKDIVQTAFVRLMQHLAHGGTDNNLRAWLVTVTANLAKDRLRGRRRWLPWDAIPAPLLAAPPDLETEDPLQQFLAAAARLEARDRLLLALKAQGLSYREIANRGRSADIGGATAGAGADPVAARARGHQHDMRKL